MQPASPNAPNTAASTTNPRATGRRFLLIPIIVVFSPIVGTQLNGLDNQGLMPPTLFPMSFSRRTLAHHMLNNATRARVAATLSTSGWVQSHATDLSADATSHYQMPRKKPERLLPMLEMPDTRLVTEKGRTPVLAIPDTPLPRL
ncbi:hypothetical protein TM48_01808 [Mycobacterium shottsii]|nr:hypothetical protein TM48_01808 [Mycobacterium shottsii]